MKKQELKNITSKEEADLVCKWENGKKVVHNGVCVYCELDAAGFIQFQLENKFPEEKDYENILCAKIYETFGVYNLGVAAKAVTDCINCLSPAIFTMKPQKVKEALQKYCENILNFFQEIRPKDSFELIMATKMFMLDYISNREFVGAVSTDDSEIRTMRQIRGIKLSRLFLEFKEKFDKHRKPGQQIHVQHNHIYNKGQAIIGSQLTSKGGK
ncbi:MAG: hypothetical protein ACFFG0_35000 [Candidatus Thorarchaeota archaeon]